MIKYVHIDIYRVIVVFFLDEKPKKIIRSLGKDIVTKEYAELINGACTDKYIGSCSRLNNDELDIVVIMKKIPKTSSEYGSLYHEIHHACRFICEDRGIDDNEAEAYLFEYVCDVITERLWRNK